MTRELILEGIEKINLHSCKDKGIKQFYIDRLEESINESTEIIELKINTYLSGLDLREELQRD